jgi:hypothetical protein
MSEQINLKSRIINFVQILIKREFGDISEEVKQKIKLEFQQYLESITAEVFQELEQGVKEVVQEVVTESVEKGINKELPIKLNDIDKKLENIINLITISHSK